MNMMITTKTTITKMGTPIETSDHNASCEKRRRRPSSTSGGRITTAAAFLLACTFGGNSSSMTPAVQAFSTSSILKSSPVVEGRTSMTWLKSSKSNQSMSSSSSATTTTSSSSNGSTGSSSRHTFQKSTQQSLSSTRERTSLGTSGGPTPLNMICQDQHEFELHVGHAMDTLRKDYPDILKHKPDFSIYAPDLELIDPSGVKLHGVRNYQAAFRLMHAIVGLFYCPERSSLTFRMCFDKARQNIRIHWNAQVIPKAIFGGYKTTLHVDGISVYEISRYTGNITQHRIERLIINDAPVQPEKGIFAAMTGYAQQSNVDSIPVFNAGGATFDFDEVFATSPQSQGLNSNNNNMVQFQNFLPTSRSFLFSTGDNDDGDERRSLSAASSTSSFDASADNNNNGNGWEDALEQKNSYRKKFGLKPLTPEEFLELQKQVAELDLQQQQKVQQYHQQKQRKQEEAAAQQQREGFVRKLFGKTFEDTCESNFDCERPKVCCDFGFKKMCCSSGMRILDGPPRSRQGQLAEIPVIANPGPQYPPNGRGGGNYGGNYY